MKTLVFLFCFGSLLFAAPAEIYIIRHADKLEQVRSEELSCDGYVRAVKFALYFMKKFGTPDFIIATDPGTGAPTLEDSKSIRELQTVAPLANLLTMQENHEILILHPFRAGEYGKLAEELLHNAQFEGKSVLICWNHHNIPQLVELLGAKTKITAWPDDDYDSVYHLRYQEGKLTQMEYLHEQYPLEKNYQWEFLF